MFTYRLRFILIFVALSIFPIKIVIAGSEFTNQKPSLGKIVTISDITAVDFVVMPDGDGLPIGSGNVESGKELFTLHCQACHGSEGVNGINGDLSGGNGTINGPVPKKTVGSYWPYATILFDYIRRAMPYQSPGILSNDEIYALSAYILYINNIIDEKEVITQKTIVDVKMPNSKNFIWAYSAKDQ